MKPPNKGHVGDNINSVVLFFVERLSSFGGSKCIRFYKETFFGARPVSFVERSIIICPYLGGSTIGGSTVRVQAIISYTGMAGKVKCIGNHGIAC